MNESEEIEQPPKESTAHGSALNALLSGRFKMTYEDILETHFGRRWFTTTDIGLELGWFYNKSLACVMSCVVKGTLKSDITEQHVRYKFKMETLQDE